MCDYNKFKKQLTNKNMNLNDLSTKDYQIWDDVKNMHDAEMEITKPFANDVKDDYQEDVSAYSEQEIQSGEAMKISEEDFV